MRLTPVGGGEAPQAAPTALPPSPDAPFVPPVSAAARAEIERQAQEKRKERQTLGKSLALMGAALFIGLVIVVSYASDRIAKNRKFNHDLRVVYDANHPPKPDVQVQAPTAEQLRQAEIDDQMRRSLAEERRRAAIIDARNVVPQRRVSAPPPPRQTAFVEAPIQPAPAEVAPVASQPVDAMQSAKDDLENNVLASYGVGRKSITYRETKSGYVAIVIFVDNDMATFIYRSSGWMVDIEKTKPSIFGVEG